MTISATYSARRRLQSRLGCRPSPGVRPRPEAAHHRQRRSSHRRNRLQVPHRTEMNRRQPDPGRNAENYVRTGDSARTDCGQYTTYTARIFGDMYQMSGCRAHRMFALRNGQCPHQGSSSACTCVRHNDEAIGVAPGRADERGSRLVAIAAMSLAVEASAADVPDNRPLSMARSAGRPWPLGIEKFRVGHRGIGWWTAMPTPAAVPMLPSADDGRGARLALRRWIRSPAGARSRPAGRCCW